LDVMHFPPLRATTLVAMLAGCSGRPPVEAEPILARMSPPGVVAQTSGTTALLQAVSPVSEQVVWVSGHQGTFARTLDGGATWQAGRVPGAETMEFRDVHAVNADVAYLMAAGTGELSRIYRTDDGGRNWALQHLNREPTAFFDCIAFWDARRGFVFSDAVGATHYIMVTTDGGARWERIPADRIPPALPNEGSFAASGTCAATMGNATGFVGTGNTSASRALRTEDGGRTWTTAIVPVVSGEAAGLASIVFRDAMHGVALGGEIGKNSARGDYVATTADGGKSWTPGGRPTFAGPVYGAAYLPRAGAMLVAVGPGGADVSPDDGRSWTKLDSLGYWSVGFASPRAGWAVGARGRIVKFQLYQ
jgi:photosystem II stability/assembly factor-like uncharacterized protein